MSAETANAMLVRSLFTAYWEQDRDAAERLLGKDFTFTSPQDDHIDRSAYFERCFPTARRFRFQEILAIADAGDDGVFVLYEYELEEGSRYRNTEFITVRRGQVNATQVFFGGREPTA